MTLTALPNLSMPQGDTDTLRIRRGATITAAAGSVRAARIDLLADEDTWPEVVADLEFTDAGSGWWQADIDAATIPVGAWWYDVVLDVNDQANPKRLAAARLTIGGVVHDG